MTERKRPARLRPGDRVAVVAPSGPVDPLRLERGCAVLRGFGLDVRPAPHLQGPRGPHGYLAAGDQQRARDLQEAWLDPGVAAVVCARGGYGAARLLELLDWPALACAPPKVLLGSSDVTAVHAAFGARLGVATLFGPMPASGVIGGERADPASVEALRRALFDPEGARVLTDRSATAPVGGTARGILVGGTLTLLAAGLGTPYAGSARGGIVVLEDVSEAPYRLDRYLTQLLQAGWFDGVRGVVLGSWLGCGRPGEALDVVVERLGPLGVPILAGLAFGHGVPQLSVPLGVRAELDTDRRSITVDRPWLI